MSQESLENFGAYRLAMELFDLVVQDTGQIEKHAQTYRLVAQQVASADSICANIEEGHGRETTRDYTHFLVMARGSARETRGRYLRMKHWLAPEAAHLDNAIEPPRRWVHGDLGESSTS